MLAISVFLTLLLILISIPSILSSIIIYDESQFIDYFQLFNSFVSQYHPEYQHNEEQKLLRYPIWKNNYNTILTNPKLFGQNYLTDRTENEMKCNLIYNYLLAFKGRLKPKRPNNSNSSTTGIKNSKPRKKRFAANNPTQFDWRDYGIITPVKNQKTCGACWAYSTTAFFESQFIRRNLATNEIDLSQQFFYQCDTQSDGCNGGYLQTAIDLGIKTLNGIPSQQQFKFDRYKSQTTGCNSKTGIKLQASNRITFTEGLSDDQIIHYLLQRPLNIGIGSKNWSNYKPKQINVRTFVCDSSINSYDTLDHTVLLVGYTQTEWIVKNQWGNGWGIDGYIYIARGDQQDCGIGWEVHTFDYQLTPYDLLITVPQTAASASQSSNNAIQGTTSSAAPASSNLISNPQPTASLPSSTSPIPTSPFQTSCKLQNCQVCYQSNTQCYSCIQNYAINLLTSLCIPSSIKNCNLIYAFPNGLASCYQCKKKFTLNNDGQCYISGR